MVWGYSDVLGVLHQHFIAFVVVTWALQCLGGVIWGIVGGVLKAIASRD